MIRLRAPQDDLLCSLTLTSPACSVRRDRFSPFSHICMSHHDIMTLCICEINGSGGFLLHIISSSPPGYGASGHGSMYDGEIPSL